MADRARDFGLNASDYARLRPSYPDAVFETLAARVGAPRRKAVDLGAGSGLATRALSAHFARAVAVEPDARLLETADLPGNVETMVMSAEEADFEPGSIDAVISATAFHWMDQPVICRSVKRWLRPGGAFFPFAYGKFDLPDALAPLFAQEWKKWAPYRDARLDSQYDYFSALKSSGVFASVEPYTSRFERGYSARDAAFFAATTSFGGAYAREHGGIGDYADFLEKEIRRVSNTVVIGFPLSGAVGVVA